MKFSTKVFLLLLLNWIDGLATLFFIEIKEFGESLEQSPLISSLIGSLGVEGTFILKNVGLSILALILLLLYGKEDTSKLVTYLFNFTLIVYSVLTIVHIANTVTYYTVM